MTAELIISLGAWGAFAVLLAMLWQHKTECNQRQQDMGKLMEAVAELQREFGNREGGMVKSLHDFKAEIRTALARTSLARKDGDR